MATILRDTVTASGRTIYRISKDSGVNRISLMRFMRGDTDLTLRAASRLADYFGLVLAPKDTRKG